MFPTKHITVRILKQVFLFLLLFLIVSVLIQEVWRKITENENEGNQCKGNKKTNLIKKVNKIEIAAHVMMPQIGYETMQVIDYEQIYKVDG